MAPHNYSRDTESVYFVHPSESSSSLSISPKLNGSNYIAWSRTVERSLVDKEQIRVHQWFYSYASLGTVQPSGSILGH